MEVLKTLAKKSLLPVYLMPFLMLNAGCFNPAKAYKKLQSNVAYKGKLIATANSLFFVLDKGEKFGKHIALALPNNLGYLYPSIPKLLADSNFALTRLSVSGGSLTVIDAKISYRVAAMGDSFAARAPIYIHKINLLLNNTGTTRAYLAEGLYERVEKMVIYAKNRTDSIVLDAASHRFYKPGPQH